MDMLLATGEQTNHCADGDGAAFARLEGGFIDRFAGGHV